MTAAQPSVTVPARFNGPATSGNGGYSAGLVAAFVDGPAQVSLRRPVPLDRALEVALGDGGAVRLLDAGELVAEGVPSPRLDLDVPAPVDPATARAAAARYRGGPGLFERCFVCGLSRDDALGVFAGPVEGRELVATPWTAPSWTAGADGNVRPEIVWAVLDCPTYFALHLHEDLTMSMLVRLAADIRSPVPAGVEHVVIAWPIEIDGRKRHAGSAVLGADGEVLAAARAMLVEARAS